MLKNIYTKSPAFYIQPFSHTQNKISTVTKTELPKIINLFNAYRMETGKASNINAVRSYLTARVEQNESTLFLAQKQGQAVGFIQLFPQYGAISMKKKWYIQDLFLSPQHRQQGIAEQLLNKAKALAAEDGSKLFLKTKRTNQAAQALYKKHGFTIDSDDITFEWQPKAPRAK